MERTEVIKALECCTSETENEFDCNKCPYIFKGCNINVQRDALSLINELTEGYESMAKSVNKASDLILKLRVEKKELTEKVEDLTETVKVRGETIEKLQFLTNEIEEDNRKLTEENERLSAYNENLIKANTYFSNHLLDEVEQAKDIAIADTLSELKIRLTREVGTYLSISIMKVSDMFKLIDQIAKEMIENG